MILVTFFYNIDSVQEHLCIVYHSVSDSCTNFFVYVN